MIYMSKLFMLITYIYIYTYSDVKYVKIVNKVFGGKWEEGKELDEKVNNVKWVIRVIERKMEVDLSYINEENVIVNKEVWDGMCLLNVIVDLLSVIKESEEGKGEGIIDNDNDNDNSGDIVINDKALTDVEDEGEYGFVKTKLLTEANNIVITSKKIKKSINKNKVQTMSMLIQIF